MYLLPKLRAIAPERYDQLRCMPALRPSTWRDAMRGEFMYACQAMSGRSARPPAVTATP